MGWVTGHSYLLYGPLACGATTLMFEGVPNWPTPARMCQVVDKHKVSILYTAPTAIRALMAEGDKAIEGTDRSSLRILGSVGEPINPEAWEWYWKKIGNEKCPVMDTWWQTETGGFMITPLPGAIELKAGSATRPFFGVQPVLVDNEGLPLDGATEGNLAIADSWPGQARTLFGDHERFEQTYFSTFKNMYFSGDGARRDEDGYYWITGRVDDVLNVSGHRLGTAEIESALVSHPKIAEAAVVGIPHNIKGQAIYAYVTLNHGEEPTPELYAEVRNWVRKEIGPLATPDVLHWTDSLPKTRSGKIMRRILRKIAAGDTSNLGDTSTLADPGVVEKTARREAGHYHAIVSRDRFPTPSPLPGEDKNKSLPRISLAGTPSATPVPAPSPEGLLSPASAEWMTKGRPPGDAKMNEQLCQRIENSAHFRGVSCITATVCRHSVSDYVSDLRGLYFAYRLCTRLARHPAARRNQRHPRDPARHWRDRHFVYPDRYLCLAS